MKLPRRSRTPQPSAPSLDAVLSIAVYWGVWLLLLAAIVTGHFRGSGLAAFVLLVVATALAAWFTWVKLKDDERQRQLDAYGPADDDADELASPAQRFVLAVVLGLGGMGCLVVAALWPAARSELSLLGLGAVVWAVYTLFFGRRGRGDSIDLD